MEHHHRNSELSHEKWWFSIVIPIKMVIFHRFLYVYHVGDPPFSKSLGQVTTPTRRSACVAPWKGAWIHLRRDRIISSVVKNARFHGKIMGKSWENMGHPGWIWRFESVLMGKTWVIGISNRHVWWPEARKTPDFGMIWTVWSENSSENSSLSWETQMQIIKEQKLWFDVCWAILNFFNVVLTCFNQNIMVLKTRVEQEKSELWLG